MTPTPAQPAPGAARRKRVVIALGGSTNAVLHLLAIAHAANVKLNIDDFTRIGARVPVLADLRPSGRYSMSELIRIGGIQPLMKKLRGLHRKMQELERRLAAQEKRRTLPDDDVQAAGLRRQAGDAPVVAADVQHAAVHQPAKAPRQRPRRIAMHASSDPGSRESTS